MYIAFVILYISPFSYILKSSLSRVCYSSINISNFNEDAQDSFWSFSQLDGLLSLPRKLAT